MAKEHSGSIHLPDFKHVGYNLRGEAKRAYMCPYYNPIKRKKANARMKVVLDFVRLINRDSVLACTADMVCKEYYNNEDAHYEPEVMALIELCIRAADFFSHDNPCMLDLARNNFRMDNEGNLILLDLLYMVSEHRKVTQKAREKHKLTHNW